MGRWKLLKFRVMFFTYVCCSFVNGENFGMCRNPDCSEPVAIGETNQKYVPDESNGLSFNGGVEVEIYVRGYGEKDKLGVKINGKKGYVPKYMVKESKKLTDTLVPAKRNFMDVVPSSGHSINPTSHEVAGSPHQHGTVNVQSTPSQISGPSKLMYSSTYPVLSPSHVLKKSEPEEQYMIQSSSIRTNSVSKSTAVPGLTIQNLNENGGLVSHDVPGQHEDPKRAKQHEGSSIQNADHTLSSSAQVHEAPPSNSIKSGSSTINPHKTSPDSISLPSMKTEELSSTSEDSSKKELAAKTEKIVMKTVEIVASAHSDSQNSHPDVDEVVMDAELQKTLAQLASWGENTSDIMQELSTTSSTENTLNSVSESYVVYKSSDILQTTESPIHSNMSLNPGFHSASFDGTSDIHPTSVTNHHDESKSEEMTQPEENSHKHQEANMPEVGATHEVTTENRNEDSEETTYLPDKSKGVNENENMELDNYVDNDAYDDDIDQTAGVQTNSSEALMQDKLNDSSKFDSIDDDDNGRESDLNDNVMENSEFAQKSVPVTAVSESDHIANHNDSVESDVKSGELVTHTSDLSEAESKESFSVPEGIQGVSNDNFDLDTNVHVSAQRHILQDNNSGSTSVDYDSKNPNELGDSQNPHVAFPESPEQHNSNAKTEEIIESSSIFSMIMVYETCSNTVEALRTLLDYLILWIPEPINSYISASGISARAAVFTGIIAFPCALLFLATFFVKERSKEESLKGLLRETEHKLYLASTERDILRDEAKNLKQQLLSLDTSLAEEKSVNAEIQKRLEEMEFLNKTVNSKQKANIDAIKDLHMKNDDYVKEISDLQLSVSETKKQNADIMAQLREEQNTVAYMNEEIAKLKQDIDELESEKELNENNYYENEKSYKEKITQLEQSCSQLLQEAEVWNSRVNELNEQLYNQVSAKEDLEKLIESKDAEIESLKVAFSNLEVFQNMKTSGEDEKTVEEQMKAFMDVSSVQNELQKAEEINKSLTERLQIEKKKVLDMEVELLESKSDVEKMRANYNQALQDKAEAQTKLDVLTKYFKDKELQLQKELGFQEAVRQRKEEDATHAERRVILIEKENESYKYQVATLKLEIEETERNLKNQIAAQEKKAHENWLAARAAERKAEELKQESANLRQRLTLLEREQENWLNSSQSDIVRPVPQRLSDTHDLSGSQEGSISSEFIPRHIPPPPGMHDDLPLPMRPSSRPLLPPMMPPPPPRFMPPPPFDPMVPPPQPYGPPWRMLPEKHFDSQRRNTPSDFEASGPRRHHTPPYYESDRRSLSPADGNSRSRGSSPHEALPDFHNVPPPLQRHPEHYPPGQPPRRYPPMRPSFRSLPSFKTVNQLGNDGNRPVNDKEFRQLHTDADV